MSLDSILSEGIRRIKRSLDGAVSMRKAFIIIISCLVLLLYVGPGFLSWLLGHSHVGKDIPDVDSLSSNHGPGSCFRPGFSEYTEDLKKGDAVFLQGSNSESYLPYVGNGYIGMSLSSESPLYIFGAKRTLNAPLHFSPLITPELQVRSWRHRPEESAVFLHFASGFAHVFRCPVENDDTNSEMSVSTVVYAHRSLPNLLVQEIKLDNPSNEKKTFKLRRTGISKEWESSQSSGNTMIEGKEFFFITGTEPFAAPEESDDPSTADLKRVVTIATQKLEKTITIYPRSSENLIVFTSAVYSDPIHSNEDLTDLKLKTKERVNKTLKKAFSMPYNRLRLLHESVWRQHLWKTGFGISYSHAENAVNGLQINATIYYVLSQVPATLHSVYTPPEIKKELENYLAYSEGCYGGQPSTLNAPNLWSSLTNINAVNKVVKLWKLTLEKHGCHLLIKAGADGVAQALVLSFIGLVFRKHHLELNAHPKDLHRDYYVRRLRFEGNESLISLSVIVQNDNKALLRVSMDHSSRDYFACDAGCLDEPVLLGRESKDFPVKLTEPVTAILYITSDYAHIRELKDTIHVREVADAPAHEHHVIALHKHGNKLGGLPAIFWFSIGFFIFVFHVFLFKLVWQEYCSGNDKMRTRKHSDYGPWEK